MSTAEPRWSSNNSPRTSLSQLRRPITDQSILLQGDTFSSHKESKHRRLKNSWRHLAVDSWFTIPGTSVWKINNNVWSNKNNKLQFQLVLPSSWWYSFSSGISTLSSGISFFSDVCFFRSSGGMDWANSDEMTFSGPNLASLSGNKNYKLVSILNMGVFIGKIPPKVHR